MRTSAPYHLNITWERKVNWSYFESLEYYPQYRNAIMLSSLRRLYFVYSSVYEKLLTIKSKKKIFKQLWIRGNSGNPSMKKKTKNKKLTFFAEFSKVRAKKWWKVINSENCPISSPQMKNFRKFLCARGKKAYQLEKFQEVPPPPLLVLWIRYAFEVVMMMKNLCVKYSVELAGKKTPSPITSMSNKWNYLL